MACSTKAHPSEVTRVLFSPDGQALASAGEAGVILWNVATGEPYAYLRGHDTRVKSLAFSPDGQELASADETNRILLWTTGGANEIPPTPTTRSFLFRKSDAMSMAISPNQKMIALGGSEGNVRVFESATGKVIKTLVTDPDCGSPSSFSRSYNPCFLNVITFSQDSNHLIAASSTGNIIIWDTRTWMRLADPLQADVPCGSLLCNIGSVWGLTFSPDMSMVAAKGKGEIWVWDLHNRKLIYHINGHNGQSITTVTFSPDGKLLASGGEDRTIILWNLENGQQSGAPLKGHIAPIAMLTFNPQGNQLVSSSYDNTLRFWNPQTHQEIGHISNEFTRTNGAVAFSPNGRYIAGITTTGSVTIWDSLTQQAITPPLSVPSPMSAMTFTPDNRHLATVSSSLLNPPSTYVTLRSYQISDWRTQACQIISRNLTMDEFNGYSLVNVGNLQVCPSLPVHSSVVRDKISQAQDAVDHHNSTTASATFTQATQWATSSDDINLNYFVCVDGSLNRFPREVLSACQHAIDLAPDDKMYLDSRGVARVLLGDYSGAIQDFQTFVDWAKRYNILQDFEDRMLPEREGWIAKLKAHDTSFIPQMLTALRVEYKNESPECRSGHCPLA
jgi:WD40 repeat protein